MDAVKLRMTIHLHIALEDGFLVVQQQLFEFVPRQIKVRICWFGKNHDPEYLLVIEDVDEEWILLWRVCSKMHLKPVHVDMVVIQFFDQV